MKRQSAILGQISFRALMALGMAAWAILANGQNCPVAGAAYTNVGWPQGAKVYYTTSGLSSAQASAVANAVGQWNAANLANGSNVQFLPANANNPPVYGFAGSPTAAPGTTSVCTPSSTAVARTCQSFNQGTQNTVGAETVLNPTGVTRAGTLAWNPSAPGYADALVQDLLHEMGHTMDLNDQSGTNGSSVMNQFAGTNDSAGNVPDTITAFDNSQVQCSPHYPPPAPPPPPTQTCDPSLGTCNPLTCFAPICGPLDYFDYNTCKCVYEQSNPSPIIIDTDGKGFHLTSPANGVVFDFYGNGKPIQIAWTAEGSTNGWLALDRNGDGKIDSGLDLFGNITAQPPSSGPNGFLALAVFDLPENGGNGDGVIDIDDAVWPKLLVWIDTNHDGVSEPEELHHLDDIGVHSISLAYVKTPFKDEYGNQFRYKGKLDPDRGDDVGRIIYDVFLTELHPQTPSANSTHELEPRPHSFASLFANPDTR
jgi:hypothetical protein